MLHLVQIGFIFSLLCTVVSLAFGIYVYFKGGDLHARYGNASMRWRVTFQGLTLMLFLLMLWLRH